MQWLRLHNKLLNDPVVQSLTDKEFKIYINLLCHASMLNKDGHIGTINETAFALRETIENVSSCFMAFQEVELLVSSATDSETFRIPQWRKKQYKSDTSTDRVKKHREKVKRSKTVTVTPPETDTDTEQIHNTLTSSEDDLYEAPVIEKIPYQQVIDIYHTECPELPRVAKLTDTRKKQIKARWKDKDFSCDNLEFWLTYFKAVNQSEFLSGRVLGSNWSADFQWLTKLENFVKVLEGKYV